MGKNGKIGIVHIRDTKNPLKLFYLQSMLKWINFKQWEDAFVACKMHLEQQASLSPSPCVSWTACLVAREGCLVTGSFVVLPWCPTLEHLGQVMAAVAGTRPCQGARVCSPQCWHYQGEGQGSRPDSLKDTAFISTSLCRWSFGRTVFLNFILSHL